MSTYMQHYLKAATNNIDKASPKDAKNKGIAVPNDAPAVNDDRVRVILSKLGKAG